MSAMVLPKEISQALVELTGEPREGMALVLLMRDYARESDYIEWEALVTRRQRLEASFAWLP